MDPNIVPETTVVVEQEISPVGVGETTVIVENHDPLYVPPIYPVQPAVVVQNPPLARVGMPCVGRPYVGVPGATTVIAPGAVHHVGYPGPTTVIYPNPTVRYCDSMEADRDHDGYIIDDDYYYYDNRYYTDGDYYDKDHYWKYFKTPNGEKFKYSRK